MKKEVYLGLYLGGIKKDKSSLLVLESFEGQTKVVISNIESKFKNTKIELFPDEILKKQILTYKNIKAIGVNFPVSTPSCLTCRLKCPGVKACKVDEVKWLVREYKKSSKLTGGSSKERKIPSPYSERAIDYYMSNLLEEPFPLEPAFGSSRSSFYARGQFLMKGLKGQKFIEIFTKPALWRLGSKYGIRKSVLRSFYRSERSEENRKLFLDKLEKDFFIYEEDRENLISGKGNFEALICALSTYAHAKKESENFPRYVLSTKHRVSLPL